MKSVIVPLLQQRMDKCTTEQFWAVAALLAADGFIVDKRAVLVAALPRWLLLVFVTVAGAYGVWFIVQRHIGYYRYRDDLAVLLAPEKDVPEFLRHEPRPHSLNRFSGVTFYVLAVLIGSVTCFAVILKT
jgi:lysylphosphatidylglycerol synthetase-like protein (DUF2156 family)